MCVKNFCERCGTYGETSFDMQSCKYLCQNCRDETTSLKDVKTMNIQDVDVKEELKSLKGVDRWIALFNLIEKGLQIYGIERGDENLTSRKKQQQLRETANYCVEEIYEALNCLKNKPWVKMETEVDLGHYLDESSDAAIFFIQWMVLSGWTPEKLFEAILRKNKVNMFRIRSGY